MDHIAIIEYLTKSQAIREGKFDEALHEILEKSTEGLNIERSNAWSIDKDFTRLSCVGSYSSATRKFEKGLVLTRKELPNYFQHLQFAEKIVSEDAQHAAINQELLQSYLIPNHITSMMDIPIRIQGKMIGLICFEHTGEMRKWTLNDQSFALSIAQLISLAIESFQKNELNKRLQQSLKEKEILLSEINHRVKNNISVIASLLNLQKHKAKDDFHRNLIEESREKLLSMIFVHEQLYRTENFSEIDMAYYLNHLIDHLSTSFQNDKNIVIHKEIEPISLNIKKAISCGLITNEIVTNAYKHAFNGRKTGSIDVEVKREGMNYLMMFTNDGPSFSKDNQRDDSAGIGLVQSLVEQLDGSMEIHHETPTIEIRFPI